MPGIRQRALRSFISWSDRHPAGRSALAFLCCLFLPANILVAQDQRRSTTLTERSSKARLADGILGIDYTADGSLIALAARRPNSIFLLDPRNLRVIRQLDGHLGTVFRVKFTADGKTLVSASDDGTLRVWDLQKQEQRLVLDQHQGGVRGLDVTADGTMAYAGESDKSFRGTVKAWRLADGQLAGELKNYQGGVQSLNLSRDDSFLVTASRDKSIRIWDRATLRERKVFDMGGLSAGRVILAPDSRSVIASMSDFSVRIFDATDGSKTHQIDPKGKFLPAIAVSPDGQLLATSDLDRIHLWRWPEVTHLTQSQGLGGNVAAIVFAPDGRSVVAAGTTGFVRIFAVAN